MHEVLVNRLGGLSLPRKSVVRLTDRPDMTFDDVYRGRKTTIQHADSARLPPISHQCDWLFLEVRVFHTLSGKGVLVLLVYNSDVVPLFPGILLLLQVPPFTFGPPVNCHHDI